jgi:hypothetical protein
MVSRWDADTGLIFLDNASIFWTPAKCEVAHTSFRLAPSKVRHGDIYLATGGDTIAPKTEPARLVFAVGVALTILAAMTWALAAPSASLIYRPDLPLLY